jgi:alpha-glucosidase
MRIVTMGRVLLPACCALLLGRLGAADLGAFEAIGPVAGFETTKSAVTITCRDRSQVRLQPLAADLVRVRVAFQESLPERDHSWAIAKTSWDVPRWKMTEQTGALVMATDELEVVIDRASMRIEFRDARTHRPINADERPMMRNPKTLAVAVAKKLGFDEQFYGLGEKAARLNKRRGHFTMWNTDAYAYKEGTDPLYQSVPFYIGLENGAAYGIFYDNSYRTDFDLGNTTQEYALFEAAGGTIDYYFFAGPSMKKVVGRYADLTGHMPLPPLWSLGHQQSRYSYYPDKLVEQVAARYRADDLPLDAIHLDIHYMEGYRDFTWNRERFPDPKALTSRLRGQGIKVVNIVDPGIKFQPPAPGAKTGSSERPELARPDESYYVYNEGLAGDYFLKRKDGRPYIGQVWPGLAVFVDYTLPAAARWWGDLFRAYTDEGVAGIWMDMNEPSDFADQTGTSQADVISYDQGAYSPYAKNRNLFALQMARATYEGLERLKPRERPFVITRAGYAGIQRYAVKWTGDNNATWDALSVSIPMFQTLGLSGEPFVGADVGGFAGATNAELLTRWYEVAFLAPFFRNHAEMGAPDHEPWRFGTYYEDIIRKYLKLRYRLLPFLYTGLEEAHRTGVPLFRPLVLNFQDDPNTYNLDDEFMVGDDLLAAPILKPSTTRRAVYLPKGTWFDFWTRERYKGGAMIQVEAPLEVVPLFVRGGAVLPLGPEMNWVGEKPLSPLTFEIFPDERGQAAASLYEDDGSSPAHADGVFRRTPVRVSQAADGIDIRVDEPQGTYRSPARELAFELSTLHSAHVMVDGKAPAASAWSQAGGRLSVRVPDGGGSHRVQIRGRSSMGPD